MHVSCTRVGSRGMRDMMTYLGDFRVHGCCSDGGGQVGRRRAEWNANTERHVGKPRFLANPNGGPAICIPTSLADIHLGARVQNKKERQNIIT